MFLRFIRNLIVFSRAERACTRGDVILAAVVVLRQRAGGVAAATPAVVLEGVIAEAAYVRSLSPVSYTHLTLPPIYSV